VTTSARDAASDAYLRALGHLQREQRPNGAFAGEVVWNPMLPCQYVILCHVLGHEIPAERKQRIRLALERQVRPDGGWGMHPDSPSWLFHTTLGYVALRLLGAPTDDPLAAGARSWIEQHGGVWSIPTWGRIWLAMLGLYPWDGVQPIVPELWLMPDASPLHPRRLYCHMRLIYLGLSFLYGHRFVAPRDHVLAALRNELYPTGYDERRFARHTDDIADTDLFEKPSPALRRAFALMRRLERFTPPAIRKRALARAMEHIGFEFRSTGFVCLSPVNGLLFCLALHITDPKHPDLRKALRGLEYWFWEDDVDGLRIAGARSDIWDTSFLVQALAEQPEPELAHELARAACRWLPTAQIQEEITGGAAHYRSPAYGGWGFANENHPWPVSDCTAEAAEALLRAERAGLSDETGRLQVGRVLAALEFILRRQNEDGGFGSYEARRGSMVLRRFNPAEIYGNCMLEYSYTECTGSCVRALAWIGRQLEGNSGDDVGEDLSRRLRRAVDKGKAFLLAQQHESGAWLGFWGINGTYGTMFAVSGLLAAGVGRTNPAIVRACRWLVETQRKDGGWGESYIGMLQNRPVPLPDHVPSTATQTAWAVLALLEAAPHERLAIDRGIDLLRSRQQADGRWPDELATGVFFNTAVLDYVLYRQIFPTWALARYLKTYA
jgi:lanosterol synthase